MEAAKQLFLAEIGTVAARKGNYSMFPFLARKDVSGKLHRGPLEI